MWTFRISIVNPEGASFFKFTHPFFCDSIHTSFFRGSYLHTLGDAFNLSIQIDSRTTLSKSRLKSNSNIINIFPKTNRQEEFREELAVVIVLATHYVCR